RQAAPRPPASRRPGATRPTTAKRGGASRVVRGHRVRYLASAPSPDLDSEHTQANGPFLRGDDVIVTFSRRCRCGSAARARERAAHGRNTRTGSLPCVTSAGGLSRPSAILLRSVL